MHNFVRNDSICQVCSQIYYLPIMCIVWIIHYLHRTCTIPMVRLALIGDISRYDDRDQAREAAMLREFGYLPSDA